METKRGCSFSLISKSLILVMLLIDVGFSDQSILGLKRRVDGDSFQVKTTLFCTKNICQKYNADLTTSGLGRSCMCRCSGTIVDPTRTFYDKVSRCMRDNAIALDNSCTVTANDGSSPSSSLLTIDSNMSKTKDIKLDNIPKECRSIKVSWSYYKNKAWVPGENNIFSAISKMDISTLGKKIWILQISSSFPQTINGLLVKVTLQYVYDDMFNPKHCIMFKVLGERKVNFPTQRPSIATTVLAKASRPLTTKFNRPSKETNEVSYPTSPAIPSSTEEPTTTIPINPKNNVSKDEDQTLLIGFVTGGVTFLIIILFIFVGYCMFLQRKKNNKAKKASMARSRPSVPLPPTSPPHNYEYVVYPELNENIPSVNAIDNASYGRGPDNELIIRTPAISIESLISKHTNSSKSNHSIVSATLMTHDYTHLQDQDKNNHEGNSIYQPLIRQKETLADKNDNETPCTPQEDEGPTGYIEPRNNKAPEYMELEPIESEV